MSHSLSLKRRCLRLMTWPDKRYEHETHIPGNLMYARTLALLRSILSLPPRKGTMGLSISAIAAEGTAIAPRTAAAEAAFLMKSPRLAGVFSAAITTVDLFMHPHWCLRYTRTRAQPSPIQQLSRHTLLQQRVFLLRWSVVPIHQKSLSWGIKHLVSLAKVPK